MNNEQDTNKGLTFVWQQKQEISTSSAPELKAKKSNAKILLIAGGLPASGKSSHLSKLKEKLTADYNQTVEYIDKDLIGLEIYKKTGKEPESLVIYAEMLKLAKDALSILDKDIVFLEGNIIGRLELFADFIAEQYSQGVTIICLDFLCSDDERYNRMLQRAKVDKMAAERDSQKINDLSYFQKHTAQQKELHDQQLKIHSPLFDKEFLKLLPIETSGKPIDANVKTILEAMPQIDPKAPDYLTSSSSKNNPF